MLCEEELVAFDFLACSGTVLGMIMNVMVFIIWFGSIMEVYVLVLFLWRSDEEIRLLDCVFCSFDVILHHA